jgi:hypothetical protein
MWRLKRSPSATIVKTTIAGYLPYIQFSLV